MKKKIIHDRFKPGSIAPFPGWSPNSIQVIDSLISAADKGNHSLLAVLPYDVSPGSLAAYLSLHFLHNLPSPPEPHCRIALYPGRYFREDLERVSFDPRILSRICASARVCSAYQQVAKTAERLLKRINQGELDAISFHWFWRCDRVWDHYGKEDREQLGPRNYFGRDDPYEATIDFLMNEQLVLHPKRHYDILIFCPFYQRLFEVDWKERLENAGKIIRDFPADLKLTIVRSPYDYWARKLEKVPDIEALACTIGDFPKDRPIDANAIDLKIVDQYLSLEECFSLSEAIGKTAIKFPEDDLHPIRLIHKSFRRLLAGLAPIGAEEGRVLADDLRLAFSRLELLQDPAIKDLLEKVIPSASESKKPPKLEACLEFLNANPDTELWTTFETDRQALQDAIAIQGLSDMVVVKRADQRMDFLRGIRKQVTVLTRIDRDSDLDWVSYLRLGDCIIMSSWEAAIRSGTIMRLWERSERWRENSERLGLIKREAKSADPVLDLADRLDKLRRQTVKVEPVVSEQEYEGDSEWWDKTYRSRPAIPSVARHEIVEQKDGIPCIEVHFKDGTGIFLREEMEIQIFRGIQEETEILGIDPSDLQPGDILVLTRDEERGTIFDILIDHLRGTTRFGTDAETVKLWKDKLRAAFSKSGFSIGSLADFLTKGGGHADPATIRSWIFGAVMAPRDKENLDALYNSLKIDSPSKEQVETSVLRLRGILRALGRLLNRYLIERELSPAKRRDFEKLVSDAGVDPDSIRAAVEIKTVEKVVSRNIPLAPNYIHRIFKLSS